MERTHRANVMSTKIKNLVDPEALYLKLPFPLQNIICSMVGWHIQRTRYVASFWEFHKEAEKRAHWSMEQVRNYRDQRLHAFVQHCAQTVPYYRRWFQKNNVEPKDIRTLEDLRWLPILQKETVQDHYSEFVSEAVPKRKRRIIHTSGTTGSGLRLTTTQQARQEQYAIWWRFNRWHGLEQGKWCGYFGGRSIVSLSQRHPPFWRYNYPMRQLLFSAYHMSPTNMMAYIEELRGKQPPWLHGYPSLLALLASYVVDNGIDLGYQIRWITIGSENLLSHQVAIIERAFGVRPLQYYGMVEAVANISECEYGRLHVDEDFSAVEFVPNPNGQGYKVVGSNFTNLAMPLLRYDVQDVVIPSEDTCTCGHPGRIVAEIDGRREDYIILKNGACLGRMDHIFKDMINIREAQIYQKFPGEITIRVVRGQSYTDADKKMLLSEIRKRVGNDTDISIDYIDTVERSLRGKLRFVISEVPEGQLGNVPV